MARRARLTVAYDGTDFHGFAEQTNARTVMGELRVALEKVARGPVDPVGAGRTDTGVHGWGQVVSLDLPPRMDLISLQRRLNKMCGPSIAVPRVTYWMLASQKVKPVAGLPSAPAEK